MMDTTHAKAFCVLDQGGVAGDPLSREKKRLFTSSQSDYYRLNWRTGDDQYADFSFSQPSLFSEGRCALLEVIPRRYEWYIFVDDDVVFHDGFGDDAESRSSPEIPSKIASFLYHYRPLTGTFYNPGDWTQARLDIRRLAQEVVVPIKAYDITACIYHASVLPHLFPVPYHGTFGIFWFQQYVMHETHPRKQVCFAGVSVRNTAHRGHRPDAMARKREAMDLFNAATRKRNFSHRAEWSNRAVRAANRALSRSGLADREPVAFGAVTVASVYDTGTEAYRNRTVTAAPRDRAGPVLRCRTSAFDGETDTTLLLNWLASTYRIDRAAEAGTGRGVTTQFLARMCDRVLTTDFDATRLRSVKDRLSEFFGNIDYAGLSTKDIHSLHWLSGWSDAARADPARLLLYIHSLRIGVERAHALAVQAAKCRGLAERTLIAVGDASAGAWAPDVPAAPSHVPVVWPGRQPADRPARARVLLLVPSSWARLDEWTLPEGTDPGCPQCRVALPRGQWS